MQWEMVSAHAAHPGRVLHPCGVQGVREVATSPPDSSSAPDETDTVASPILTQAVTLNAD